MSHLKSNRLLPVAGFLTAVLAVLASVAPTRAALITTPGLTGVRVWEATGPVSPYNFAFNGPQMTAQLGVGVLGPNAFDFAPLGVENYDVFYSDANGTFNVNGNYVTVEAVYPVPSAGGGLNLAAVDLVFGSGTLRADLLPSWVGLGPNYISGSEVLAIDTDTPVPSTATTMGSTTTPPTQHLRVTVGWSRIPEPTSLVLGLFALAGACRRSKGPSAA
jgi:hypothetical protein